MMKKYTFFLLIIANTLCSMQRIKKTSDIDSFAGKFVAYKTESSYFGQGYGFPILNKNKYGYVSSYLSKWSNGKRETGYTLYQLLRPNDIPSTKVLVNEFLAQDNLHMRKITLEEKILILNTLRENKAKFEYASDSIFEILQNQIEK